MDKQQKEKLKQEKTDLLDQEVLKLEKEKEYIRQRHEQKMKEMDEKLDALKFQKDVFREHKVK